MPSCARISLNESSLAMKLRSSVCEAVAAQQSVRRSESDDVPLIPIRAVFDSGLIAMKYPTLPPPRLSRVSTTKSSLIEGSPQGP